MNTATKTPVTPTLDLNGNHYIARGSYRTADGKAQIDWTLANDKQGRGAIFSAQGHYNGGGGQNLDSIAKAYPNDATIQEIAAVWTTHHLNNMRPGTPAQMALGWGNGFDVALSVNEMTDAQKTALRKPVKSEIFENSIGAPCPETGKLYGHEWFFHVIPAATVEQIKAWAALDNVGGESSYVAQARQFLERNGLAMRITLSDTKPANWTPSGHHYRVTLYRTTDDKARLVFDFWGSKADAEKRVDPSVYSVLACIGSDLNTPETLKEWCNEYGEDADSIKTRQTFNRSSRFAKSLRAFLMSAEREELAEIN